MSYNVVVVDDDEIILLLHNKIIQEIGLQDSPKTFNSAHKALTFSAFLMMGIHFVVLDINMPVMDGWGLLDIIHEADFDKKLR
jgi:CheY-like chemotaxis protein